MTDDSTTDWVRIERTFDSPIDLVWKMWTESEHFAAWYGPDGASIPVAEMDVTPGGRRHVCMEMSTPNGEMQMWFVGEYREIVANERLVYTESMSDAEGNVLTPAQMGMPEGSPETTEIIVELEDLGGRTRMVMTHAGVPADSGGAGGWMMAIDKMDARLSSLTG